MGTCCSNSDKNADGVSQPNLNQPKSTKPVQSKEDSPKEVEKV